MEDKTFELLEKMYSDFSKKFEKIESDISGVKTDITGMKTDISGVKTDITGMKTDISGMKTDIRKIGVKIEGPITEMLVSLQDGYKVTYEKLTDVEKKLETLSNKVDEHDIKIEVFEGGKKKRIK